MHLPIAYSYQTEYTIILKYTQVRIRACDYFFIMYPGDFNDG